MVWAPELPPPFVPEPPEFPALGSAAGLLMVIDADEAPLVALDGPDLDDELPEWLTLEVEAPVFAAELPPVADPPVAEELPPAPPAPPVAFEFEFEVPPVALDLPPVAVAAPMAVELLLLFEFENE